MKIPLSKIQEQFWVLARLYPESSTYNIPLVYKITGEVCIDSLKNAINRTLNKHSILSSFIETEDDMPYLNIPNQADLNNFFKVLEEQELTDNLFDQILEEIHKPFDLNGGFLTRIRYIVHIDCSYLVFVFHHIIIDHHSKSIILSDISKYYSMLINNLSFDSYDPATEYKEYSIWEKNWLSSDNADKIRNEWNDALNDIDQINLPFDFNEDSTFKSRGKRIHFSLKNDISDQIEKFSTKNNIAPFIVHLSAYILLLSRIEEQSTFAIGVPLSNRKQEKFKDTVGCFVNVLPLIIRIDTKLTFKEIIKQVRAELLKNHRRQEIPFIELQSIYNKTKKGHLFHTGFTFEGPVELTLENVKVEWQTIERKGSQLELFLTLWSSEDGYQGFWEFNSDKFDIKTIYHFIDIYKTIIQETLISENKPYTQYNILPHYDKSFIETINNTQCQITDNICIHQIFEKKVLEKPNNGALIYKNKEITYKELNDYANFLAHFLIKRNIQVRDIVAIACERRIEMIISILAILKSGAVYLPLQINNPPEIIQEILDHSKPKYILASDLGSENIKNKDNVITIEHILNSQVSGNDTNPNIKVNKNSLAYIIFTSGSTGVPKGVAIKHHSVINRIEWMQKSYPLNSEDVLIQKTPVTFDVSIWELFWWFFAGGKLLLPEQNAEKDPLQIIELIKKYNVTKIHFVPSMFVYFIDVLSKLNLTAKIKSIQTIFCSGESLTPSMVNAFNHLESPFSLPQIVNLYGPTEATVDVSYYNCPSEFNNQNKIYIGRPIYNTGLYIVNSDLKVQPIGIEGELIITGVNLAVGYLHDHELTNQKFVQFEKPDGSKVLAYKTGDITRLDYNGEIEFIGRKDNQVKIRGIRIELGEIEARISKHPFISNVAVSITDETKNIEIISYVVLKKANSISKKQLFSDFRKLLSPHMLPSDIVFLDEIPMTTSGKIDKKKLPMPQIHKVSFIDNKTESFYENVLIGLWSKTLSTDNLRVTDNFYDAGGNSLLAIRLSMKIATEFSIEPDVISILEYPNIKDYAAYLENKIKSQLNKTDESNEQDKNRREIMKLRFSISRNLTK